MGLFDIVKEKVSELLSGAGDKVAEVTGAELPGGAAADQLAQSAETVTGAATSAGEDVTAMTQGLTDTAASDVQDLAGSAGGAVTNAVTDATDPSK
jgi:hypothetical protein